jgi:hypothetical protein
MNEETIQPINSVLSDLVQMMFETWLLVAKTKNETKVKLTVQSPKPMLDLTISAEDLRKMENDRSIEPNELRQRLGFEPFTEEQLKAREEVRQKSLQNKNSSSSTSQQTNNT